MIDYKPIPFVFQTHDFPNCSRDLDHARQIMLPDLGHYFFNAFLVGVPTTRARRTGEGMGCLVSSEEQHPATLQSLDACVVKKGVIPLCWLLSRSEGGMRYGRTVPDVARRWLIRLRVANREGLTPAELGQSYVDVVTRRDGTPHARREESELAGL